MGCPGCIDDRPIDCADIVFFLKPGNLGGGVGCVALAAADTALSRRKISLEKEAGKADIQFARGIADRGPFRFMCKHRVDDDGMALR